MATLIQEIKNESAWLIEYLKAEGYILDYSIKSFIEIDRYFEINCKDGKPTIGSVLSQDPGTILFSIGSYIGETLVKNIEGAEWITDDEDPDGAIKASVRFPNGPDSLTDCWPGKKAIKRFRNGFEDSIYPFGYELTKNCLNEEFDQSFWELSKPKL